MSCRVCLLTSLLALTTSALRTPRRQCIKAAGAALLPAAATALLPAAAAVAAAPSEVEAVLANERWDPESPFTREDFRRLDESDDKDFYTEPRFVYHIDDAAVAATASFYPTTRRATLCSTHLRHTERAWYIPMCACPIM